MRQEIFELKRLLFRLELFHKIEEKFGHGLDYVSRIVMGQHSEAAVFRDDPKGLLEPAALLPLCLLLLLLLLSPGAAAKEKLGSLLLGLFVEGRVTVQLKF